MSARHLIVLTMAFVPTAVLADDVFQQALAFALTGSDTSPVETIDAQQCVFMTNAASVDGAMVGDVFHLNNVQLDRVRIGVRVMLTTTQTEVSLYGASTVYEYTGPYDINPASTIVTPKEQELLQSFTRPRKADSFVVKLPTSDIERVGRAWNYIYQHGCTGTKSLF